jgi:flagellar basal-body rod modification protein FlgD
VASVELTRPTGSDIFGANDSQAQGLYGDTNDLATQEVFIELMMTQMQHQDPMDPMSNEQFLSQLAQLTTVEQLRAANTNLETLQLYQSSINNAQSVSMMGKVVKAEGDSFQYDGSGTVDLDFRLGAAATQVKVTVYDVEGNAIKVIEVGGLEAGDNEVTWSGQNDDGSPMDEGEYTYKVTATDTDQNAVLALTFIKGRVDGITFEGGIPLLHVGEHQVSMGEILEIYEE